MKQVEVLASPAKVLMAVRGAVDGTMEPAVVIGLSTRMPDSDFYALTLADAAQLQLLLLEALHDTRSILRPVDGR